jgi:hypothetical protein
MVNRQLLNKVGNKQKINNNMKSELKRFAFFVSTNFDSEGSVKSAVLKEIKNKNIGIRNKSFFFQKILETF